MRLRRWSESREVGLGAGGSTTSSVRSVVGSGDDGGDGVGDRDK